MLSENLSKCRFVSSKTNTKQNKRNEANDLVYEEENELNGKHFYMKENYKNGSSSICFENLASQKSKLGMLEKRKKLQFSWNYGRKKAKKM